MNINLQIAEELNLNPTYVDNVVQLIDEGNTIPFIARYRKELHGSMDDTTLRTLNERLEYLRNLDDRRQTIVNAITEQGKMTEELAAAIEEAKTLAELEDLYRPWKRHYRALQTLLQSSSRMMPRSALPFAIISTLLLLSALSLRRRKTRFTANTMIFPRKSAKFPGTGCLPLIAVKKRAF